MKEYVPSYPNPDDDDRPEWEKKLRPLFSAAEDVDGEGARPSSLIPYYHHKPDRAYLLQLKYAVEKANEETVRKYGPLPPGGLPVQKKTRSNVPYRDFQGNEMPRVQPIIEEEDEMKLRQVTAVAVLTAAGALAACDANREASAATPAETAKTAASPSSTASASLDVDGQRLAEASSVKIEGLSTQTELQPFIEPDMQIRAVVRGDINGDGLQDAVIVLEAVADKEKPRSVLLLVRDDSGLLHKAAQNDKIVPCANCGGMFGDPFGYAQIVDGNVTFIVEGGSRWHWWNEYTFKYSTSSKALELYEVKRGVADRITAKQKEASYTAMDFGSITFKDFDPSVIPEVAAP